MWQSCQMMRQDDALLLTIAGFFPQNEFLTRQSFIWQSNVISEITAVLVMSAWQALFISLRLCALKAHFGKLSSECCMHTENVPQTLKHRSDTVVIVPTDTHIFDLMWINT